MRDHKDVAELLIANGANVNATDRSGRTPIRRAEMQEDEWGNKKVIELLRKHGGK